jgi:hypothetical protein
MYLGADISSATKLPALRWLAGNRPTIEVGQSPQVDLQTMADGTIKASFLPTVLRSWPLVWEALTSTELAALVALRDLRQELVFQNNWESATWFYVVIQDFRVSDFIGAGTPLYNVSMTLQQLR